MSVMNTLLRMMLTSDNSVTYTTQVVICIQADMKKIVIKLGSNTGRLWILEV